MRFLTSSTPQFVCGSGPLGGACSIPPGPLAGGEEPHPALGVKLRSWAYRASQDQARKALQKPSSAYVLVAIEKSCRLAIDL